MHRFARTSRLALAVTLMAAMILPAGILAPAAADAAPAAPADAPATAPRTAQGGGGRSPRIADRQQTRPGTPSTTPAPTTTATDTTPAEPAEPAPTPASSLAVPSPLGAGPDSPLTPTSPLHPATAAPAGAPTTRAGTSVTVVFDSAGGTATFPTSQTLTKGQRCTRPTPDPTRAGYLFDGWFTGDTPFAYDFSKPVTDGLTLKAHWSRGNDTWTMTPNHGPTTGNTEVTLTPPAPRGLRFTQVSTGYEHSLAIGSDGNLYTWGDNQYGQLGRTTNNSNDPTPGPVDKPTGAPAGFTWTQATAGRGHSMAVGSDGNLYTWGRNHYGQLGRATNSGTNNPNPTPGPVDKPTSAPAGFTWTQATTGGYHSLAFGSDGNLYTWGLNQSGQLGRTTDTIGTLNPNPTPDPVDKPTSAPAGFTWTQTTAGAWHSMAVGSDGNLYTWGSNGYGQLGHDTNNVPYDSVPGPVNKPAGAPAGFTWTQATAGYEHSLAVGSDGNLYTWGRNIYGQLGRDTNNGTNTPTPTPGPVDKPTSAPAGFTWTQTTAGAWHSMAVGSDGNLYTWGNNGSGQLGRDTNNGTNTPTPTPGPVDKPTSAPAGFTWTQATAGGEHSLAVGSDGNLYTWGQNHSGQLGRDTNNGTYGTNPTPGRVDFPSPGIPARVVFDGAAGTVPARNTDGTWRVTTPAHAEGLVDTVITWHRNGVPQADAHLPYTYGAPSCTVTFDPDGGTPKPPDQQVAAGHRARRPADPVKAGHVFDGWFIGSTPTAYDFSKPVTGPVSLKAHWSPDQSWTISPDHGSELGGEQVTLTPPAPRGIRFTQVSAGSNHTLAIGSDGNLYTWGDNYCGELGRATNIGTTNPNPTPGPVDKPAGAPAGFTWTQVTARGEHSLAFGSDGNLYTWGLNHYGQLGRATNSGTRNPNPTPGPVDKPTGAPAGFTWTRATAGANYSLAFGSDGNLYTWGSNLDGELGRATNSGTNNPNPTPGPVDKPTGAPTGFTWTQATAGDAHSMAFGSDGNLYSWGRNYCGQLGRTTPAIGTNSPNPTPGPVDKPTGAPAGFTWTQATSGARYSLAVGSDGNLYTWGRNLYGELGRTANSGVRNPNPTPGPVDKPTGAPAGFTWTQATAGFYHSMAFGSDGNLYSWGGNSIGQLGHDTTETNPTPGMVDFPGPAVPTGVWFGTKPGSGLAANTDGTWRVTTPEHDPGTVTVTIDWTRNGTQAPDTGNRYEFHPIAVLPRAGGEGILTLLLTGLLAMGATLAGRRHRQDTTQTSPE